jgi:hypothetical protein
VLKVDLATGAPSLVATGITEGASLASLACGPPVNPNEMSAGGRTLPKLGKKMLSLQPLGKQLVAPDDSVLGSLSRLGDRLANQVQPTAAEQSQTGLDTTYQQMIQAAFRPEWWQSQAIVTFDTSGKPAISLSVEGFGKKGNHPAGRGSRHGNRGNGRQSGPGPGFPPATGPRGGSPGGPQDGSEPPALTTREYTVMEANFSLFFGLSIQLYLSTLVSDDTPVDRYLGGHPEALDGQRVPAERVMAGLTLFFGKAGCARCHVGAELTEASYSECYQERIDELTLMSGVAAKYDKGFVMDPTAKAGGLSLTHC